MARIAWDISEKIPELRKLGMVRLKEAAEIIQEEAKIILASRIKGPSITHPAYKTGEYAGVEWTEREAGAMLKTIRVVSKYNASDRNVWIMAGNDKTWWAVQMEYGKGDWRGGKRSFLRSAINKSIPKIKILIENG